MPKINAVDRDGSEKVIDAENGLSLMLNLRDNGGLDIASICGGMCSCATCHVYVDKDWLGKTGEQSPDEFELVEFSEHYQENSRLSCQIEMSDDLDGIKVTLAPED
ncbi:2Fe-2S iron-sulfur cluster-binding protein [Maritimibacter sp. UBA3975]|uniref:2Fe-2S iron-sulfur cluster-binding protein n=1 Tax=Maritimibacter sp. UBA3975 TaxID=1946833 RepID=UPI000C0B271B|nr:2Fe-2S iron-sulfur cluster-binding protein [Maritimibacter sp. UBA3975]MAM61302.1 ferredoxin [Maritimibacter sp.]|tara:strand:- start:8820 stop:9137 length:318 start_codon:yes stop_codon:yes gene_type:complete